MDYGVTDCRHQEWYVINCINVSFGNFLVGKFLIHAIVHSFPLLF